MTSRRPLILLSNDDGYRAKGLRVLSESLREAGDVVVCAPETQQSATSHALTLVRPLRLNDHGDHVFSIDGTPADCVYVALNSGTRLLPRAPDVIVSGLNHGLNLGTDVFYSGTVAAAREGALRGFPALAVSASHETDYVAACRVVRQLVRAVIETPVKRALLFNVNFPPGSSWRLRQTRLGTRVYQDSVDYRHDPRGGEYLWIGGPGAEHRPMVDSDTDAYDAGVVSVTPLMLDLYCESEANAASDVVRRVTESEL
jgi:5'-nucleotidase